MEMKDNPTISVKAISEISMRQETSTTIGNHMMLVQ